MSFPLARSRRWILAASCLALALVCALAAHADPDLSALQVTPGTRLVIEIELVPAAGPTPAPGATSPGSLAVTYEPLNTPPGADPPAAGAGETGAGPRSSPQPPPAETTDEPGWLLNEAEVPLEGTVPQKPISVPAREALGWNSGGEYRIDSPERRDTFIRTEADGAMRRVKLEQREGYGISLQARMLSKAVIGATFTLETYTGAPYDPMLNAFLSRPTLRTQRCSFTAPVGSLCKTVALWEPYRTGDEEPLPASLRVSFSVEPASGGAAQAAPAVQYDTSATITFACFQLDESSREWGELVRAGDTLAKLTELRKSLRVRPIWAGDFSDLHPGASPSTARFTGPWDRTLPDGNVANEDVVSFALDAVQPDDGSCRVVMVSSLGYYPEGPVVTTLNLRPGSDGRSIVMSHEFVRLDGTAVKTHLLLAVDLVSLERASQASTSDQIGGYVVQNAAAMVGKPYEFGGEDPGGFDNSGLVEWAHRQLGIKVPRTALDQWRATQEALREPLHVGVIEWGAAREITRDQLLPGDVVFFSSESRPKEPSHVGIYVGQDKFVHAPGKGQTVRVDNLAEREHYLGARRFRRPFSATVAAWTEFPSEELNWQPALLPGGTHGPEGNSPAGP